MNGTQDTNPVTDDLGKDPNEKRSRLRDGTYKLIQEAAQKIEAIKKAGLAHRNDLYEHIKESAELEKADVKLCELRLARDVARLREDIYGPQMQPLASIGKLPVELLSNIFRDHVESGYSPWVLTKVCKAWTQTAFNTPQLWVHLLFPKTAQVSYMSRCVTYVVNGRQRHSIGKWQVCLREAELDDTLQRSGTLPLNLTFESLGQNHNPASLAALVRFIGSPLSERIYSLDLGGLTVPDLGFAADVSIGQFPALKAIEVPNHVGLWLHRVLKAIESTSSQLCRAKFYGEITPELAEYSFWNRLRHITMGPHSERYDGFNLVATQLGRRLEHLEHSLNDWPNARTPISTWNNIREITLTCDPMYLSRLNLPCLEILKHRPSHILPSGSRPANDAQVLYPMLHTLDVEVNDSRWPELAANAFPAVMNLTLWSVRNDEFISATLRSMSSVRNVILKGPNTPGFGTVFLRDLQSDEVPLICPHLERLQLGGDGYVVQTPKGKVAPLLRKLVKFRQQVGKPLLELTVHWKHRNEIIDYTTAGMA